MPRACPIGIYTFRANVFAAPPPDVRKVSDLPEVGIYFPGLRPSRFAPDPIETNRKSPREQNGLCQIQTRGRSPIKRNALSEGRRPSAHRAAEPRRKKICVDTLGTSPWHPQENRCCCSRQRETPRRKAVASSSGAI